ncbi:MAG: PAS domain S-box protein [Mesorhizobium sp.]
MHRTRKNQRRSDDNNDDRLAAIIALSSDAIIAKDLNSIVTDWNEAATKLFGYTADEMIGQSILKIIPDERRDEETEIISRIMRKETVPAFETTRRRKDGTPIAVSVAVSPIRDRQGDIVGASKIARDITGMRENERRIRMLMREVNHRVKNQFAVILSMVRETNNRSTSQAEFQEKVRDRIMALARSHDLLVTSEWSGASMAELTIEHLRPFGHEEQVFVSGPMLTLVPNAVQHLGMALHELGTNSAKYGALSNKDGRVAISWRMFMDEDKRKQFEFVWDETTSSGARTEPERRRGFGSVVLQRVAPQALLGSAILEHMAGAVVWRLTAPGDAIVAVTSAETPPPQALARP